MSVLVVGSIGLDDVKTAEEAHRDLLGGSASYAAVAASFYSPVNLVGVVGDDFPTLYRELYRKQNIDLQGLEVLPGKTFRWSGEYEVDMNNRRTLSINLNVFEKFDPKLPTAYRESEFVLLANIAPSLQARVMDQINRPKFVVADTMDLWINIAREDLTGLLKRVDMLILNDSEAKQLTGLDNLIRAGKRIQEMGPRYVVVKKGEHGALLFGEGELFGTPAFPLEKVPDPTGAGDCFAGGLIGYCAAQGKADFATLRQAILYATITASFNVESFSLRRLETLTRIEIDRRVSLFRQFIEVV